METQTTDVCIIGSGPGGAAAFDYLVKNTKRQITLLEAGPNLENGQSRKGFRKTLVPKWLWGLPWISRFQPSVYANVGGASEFYASALFRFREQDFEATHHSEGSSPAWPFSYADLEPFYQHAEALLKVHGSDAGDSTAPWRSADYPHPPIDSETPVALLAKHMGETANWDPFTTPVGLESFDDQRKETTATAQSALITPHIRAQCPTADVRPGHRVLRLVQQGNRICAAVVRAPDGRVFRLEAGQFILAAGAAHSPLLLKDSGITGMGDPSLIGANYMFHQHTLVPVIDGDLAPVTYAKTLAFNKFYFGDPDAPEDEQSALGHVQIMGAMTPELLLGYGGAIARWFIPTRWVRPLTDNMILFLVSTEDLPKQENTISRNRFGTIRLRYAPTLEARHHRLVRIFMRDIRAATGKIFDLDDRTLISDRTYIRPFPPTNWLRRFFLMQSVKFKANAHQCGTLKMGDDPATSVVSGAGNLWGVQNLYITDASVFPSSAHLNPSLTIFANSLRVAAGMIERHKL